MKTKWLDRRIIAPGPYLALCLNKAEFKAICVHLNVTGSPRWLNNGADATMHPFENAKGELCCVVCLSKCKNQTPIEIAGMLVHEAVHVWQHYIKNIGERNPGDEQEAYAIQAIAQELFAEFARRIT